MNKKPDTDRLYKIAIRIYDLRRQYKQARLRAEMHKLAVSFGFKSADSMTSTISTCAKQRGVSRGEFEAAALAQRFRLTGEHPIKEEVWQVSPVTAGMLISLPWTTAALPA